MAPGLVKHLSLQGILWISVLHCSVFCHGYPESFAQAKMMAIRKKVHIAIVTVTEA